MQEYFFFCFRTFSSIHVKAYCTPIFFFLIQILLYWYTPVLFAYVFFNVHVNGFWTSWICPDTIQRDITLPCYNLSTIKVNWTITLPHIWYVNIIKIIISNACCNTKVYWISKQKSCLIYFWTPWYNELLR